jgi:hypothetical protein
MGTNYYRIPTEEELAERKERLVYKIINIDLSPQAVNMGFTIDNPGGWDRYSPWDEFVNDSLIHLGKRSGGWKFCWNFHNDKYYSDRATLEAFIRGGQVVDEYGAVFTPEEFLEMAYSWCPDGWDTQSYYEERPQDRIAWMDYSKYADRYVDGLRISSSTDFS